jgi:hypothetical protein
MTEFELTARREQFCAAFSRALTDPAFRMRLQREPGPAMAQFGFTLIRPTSASLEPAWPSKVGGLAPIPPV